MSDSQHYLARETGFSECAIALRRALSTTPVGWLLATWFCWGRVPGDAIALWLGVAGVVWAGSLAVLQHMIVRGPALALHRRWLLWIAALDGFGWGMLTWFLIGYDPVLDAILMALLCGVTSINAQVYGTYVVAYYGQIGILWAVSAVGLLKAGTGHGALDYLVGLLYLSPSPPITPAPSRSACSKASACSMPTPPWRPSWARRCARWRSMLRPTP